MSSSSWPDRPTRNDVLIGRRRPTMRARQGLVVAAAAWTLVCIGPGHVGLMHVVHPVCFGGLALWAGLVGKRLLLTVRAGVALRDSGRSARIGGVDCRVIPGGRWVFVLGVVHPRIYVGERVLRRLEPAEICAVLLHEEHHRRTAAPIRAAAIDAWLSLAGWIPVIGAQLRARLAFLETSADRFAMDRGVTPQTIASALLKTPAAPAQVNFAADGAPRIRWLAQVAHGSADLERVLPWEWLPIAAVLYMLGTCLAVAFQRSL